MTTATDDAVLGAWGAHVLAGGTQSLDEWRASRNGRKLGAAAGGAGAAQSATRPLTLAEAEVVRAFNAAYRQLGLDRGVHRVVVGGMAGALRKRSPQGGEGTAETMPEAAWAEIGAAAALGALLVSDATTRRKRPQRHPAGAGFEPLELARLSNRQLARLLVRRLVRRFRRRRPRAKARGAPRS